MKNEVEFFRFHLFFNDYLAKDKAVIVNLSFFMSDP